MIKLDNNSSTPLYTQLEQVLLELINNGTYPPGSRLPTEAELSKQYNVSRVTVRKALQPLSEKGLLERKIGKGSFVAQKKITRSLSNIMSFSDMCKAQGYKPGAKTLRIDLVEPTQDERTQLGLKEHEQMLILERLRYADERAVIIELTKFSESFFFLMNENLTNTSLYDILAKHEIFPANSIKELDIISSNYRESKYLNVSNNHPLLRIASTVKDHNNNILHLSVQLCVADSFKLYI